MKTREKVPYAKEKRERILGGVGHRGAQRIQSAPKSMVLEPKFDADKLKKIVEEGLTNAIATEGVLSISEATIASIVREAVDAESRRYQSGVNSLNDQLNAAKVKIGLMNKENDKLVHHKEHIEVLEDKVRLKDGELKRRNRRIEELEADISSFDGNVDENILILNKTVSTLNKEIRSKDKKIDSLKIKLEDRSARLMDASKQMADVRVLQEVLNEMKSQLSGIANVPGSKQSANKDKVIKELNRTLSAKDNKIEALNLKFIDRSSGLKDGLLQLQDMKPQLSDEPKLKQKSKVKKDTDDNETLYLNKAVNDLNKSLRDKDKKIKSLTLKLEDRSDRLREASSRESDIEVLKKSLDEMKLQLSAIPDKIIVVDSKSTVSESKVNEDRVFIDPSESKEHLKSHIDVEATSILSSKGDFDTNKDKLRNLLKKGSYKPTKAKLRK